VAAEHALDDLIQAIEKRHPGSPIVRKVVTVYDTAEAAGLLVNYDAYRVYCQFTHGAMRVVQGKLSKQTNAIDTKIIAWCILMILDYLKETTPARIPDTAPFKKKLIY
jgi:hypothetical protein